MFYFSLAVLAAGVLGGLFLLFEWLRHERRHIFMFFWGAGLLLMDWFQVPTILALAGKQIVYTSFNPFFSVSMPLGFLGWIMIYLGIRSVAGLRTKKTAYILLLLWFLAALALYIYQYEGARIIHTRAGLLAQMVFFLVPLQVLNLFALRFACRDSCLFARGNYRAGLITLAASVFTALSRYAFYISKVSVYPPDFALILIRSSQFYIFTQILGILLLLGGFMLIHKEMLGPALRPEDKRYP